MPRTTLKERIILELETPGEISADHILELFADWIVNENDDDDFDDTTVCWGLTLRLRKMAR